MPSQNPLPPLGGRGAGALVVCTLFDGKRVGVNAVRTFRERLRGPATANKK